MEQQANESWRDVSRIPQHGESIWIVVNDDGHRHVQYAICFEDDDANPVLFRAEPRLGCLLEDDDPWPPPDVVCWQPCDIPEAPKVACSV